MWSIPLRAILVVGRSGLYHRRDRRWPASTSSTCRKIFGGVVAVDDVSLEIADGEFLVLVGPVGLRQVDAAAHDRRPRGGDGGPDLDRRARRHRPGAEGPRHRDGLPDLRALPAHERAPEPRLRPQGAADAEGRDRAAGRRGRGDARPLRPARAAAGAALRRAAAARRDGPRDRARAAGVPARRAALEPRREASRRHARVARPSCTGGSASRPSTSRTTRSRR